MDFSGQTTNGHSLSEHMRKITFLFLSIAISAASAANAEPPAGYAWKLAFEESCSGTNLGPAWRPMNDTWSLISSKRDARNFVLLGDGLCRLVVSKADPIDNGGKAWRTAGAITGARFTQTFGYFEIRMKLARAQGINNAFWLMMRDHNPQLYFEIDVVEGDYPDMVPGTLHVRAGKDGQALQTYRARHKAAVDLSSDFHDYGLLWVPERKNGALLVWYFDGKEYGRTTCSYCTFPAMVLMTNAAMWKKPKEEIDGTQTVIDHVKVYDLVKRSR